MGVSWAASYAVHAYVLSNVTKLAGYRTSAAYRPQNYFAAARIFGDALHQNDAIVEVQRIVESAR